jgi:cell division septation protein DedD
MSHYRRSGPSPLLIVSIGALIVFGGYFVWVGVLSFLQDHGDITAPATHAANASATAQAAPVVILPSPFMPATFTPLPDCQWFKVKVSRAVYRECPSKDNNECPIRDTADYGTEFCVYSRVPGNPEWYVVELNPGGSYRDTVFMHESVLEAVNPTVTPAPTITPGPTITPVPTFTPAPTVLPSATPTPTPPPDASPTPTPTLTPSPTLPQISI